MHFTAEWHNSIKNHEKLEFCLSLLEHLCILLADPVCKNQRSYKWFITNDWRILCNTFSEATNGSMGTGGNLAIAFCSWPSAKRRPWGRHRDVIGTNEECHTWNRNRTLHRVRGHGDSFMAMPFEKMTRVNVPNVELRNWTSYNELKLAEREPLEWVMDIVGICHQNYGNYQIEAGYKIFH